MLPGTTAIAFDSSIDALDYLRRNPVDLILTDYRMPFVDGLRLIAAVRLVDQDVRIIMMSGEDLESAALATGANAFVRKTEFVRDLAAALEKLGFRGTVATSSPACGDAVRRSRRVAAEAIAHAANGVD
jgi:CheY-like chemotaxis protein